MNNLQELQRQRGIERRHMIRVKDAFASGLGLADQGAVELVHFLEACADYLGYIMTRFHDQGIANVDRLATVVDPDDADDQRVLREIGDTLAAVETQVTELTASFNRYREGSLSEQELRAAGRRFVDFYNSALAHYRDPAQQIIQRHFTPEAYWAATDDVTPDSIAAERALFEQVLASAPPQLAGELTA